MPKCFNKIVNRIQTTDLSNAPSQAHLQGTQSRHTKSQPCKRACLVPTLLGHTLSNRTQYAGGHNLTKGERITWGLPKWGQTEAVFQLFVHCASVYPA
jgi:hypothetical protein